MLERIEHPDNILELRFARPPVNAQDPAFVQALSEAVAQAPQQGARALVLSGREGLFSAGLDVPALLMLERGGIEKFWRQYFGLAGAIACSPIPVVAAITGHSPAGGAVLALFCDYRIIADGDFRIGLNEVQVGLPLPPIVHAAMVRQLGARQAERLGVQGLLLNPAAALDCGLVDEVSAMDEVLPRALAWCRQLLSLPAEAMRLTRDLARADIVELFERLDDNDYRYMADAWFAPETQASLRVLVDKLKKK